MTWKQFPIVTDTTPAAASTAVGSVVGGLDEYPIIRVDASLVGATGGVLDVYLQRFVAPNVWADWVHFTQLAAGASAVKYTVIGAHGVSTSIATIGIGTDASPGVALANGTFAGGHPGKAIRAVYVAGASTSAGAAVTFYVSGCVNIGRG